MKNTKKATMLVGLFAFLFGVLPTIALGQDGLFLSKNADFSTEDRSYDPDDVLYVKVVAPGIDSTDIDKNEFRLKPNEGGNDVEHALTNNLDGTYTTYVDLRQTDLREDDWEVRVRVRDDDGQEFRTRVDITIGEDDGDDDRGDKEVEFTGFITAIDSSSITVNNVSFRVDSTTIVLDNDNDPIGFSALVVGQRVEIKGFRQADGSILAVRIKIEDRNDDEVELTGEIENINDNSLVVAGASLAVDNNTLVLGTENEPLTIADLSEGQFAKVRVELAGSVLKATTIELQSGSVLSVGVDEEEGLPRQFTLHQNYPNPFNPTTTISFDVLDSDAANISLTIYNVLGQQVRTLLVGELNSGHYEVVWNGKNDAGQPLASGIYLYQLQVNQLVTSKTMVLMK